LVLSESLTSLNLGVCDYPRDTTPEMTKRLAEIKVFCNAFSPAPSTINALRVLLTESPAAEHDKYSSESVLAYARAAGYKIYWLSNQDIPICPLCLVPMPIKPCIKIPVLGVVVPLWMKA